jgi:hypothetical protein
MDERKTLLLAVGITQWASAAAHLDAMRKQNVKVPPDIAQSIGRELYELVRQWPTTGIDTPVEKVIADARRYCTEHADQVDAVMTEAGWRG